MNPSFQAAVAGAIRAIQVVEEPELFVTKVGPLQLERLGAGDVQELSIGKERKADPLKLDGNISANDFERAW